MPTGLNGYIKAHRIKSMNDFNNHVKKRSGITNLINSIKYGYAYYTVHQDESEEMKMIFMETMATKILGIDVKHFMKKSSVGRTKSVNTLHLRLEDIQFMMEDFLKLNTLTFDLIRNFDLYRCGDSTFILQQKIYHHNMLSRVNELHDIFHVENEPDPPYTYFKIDIFRSLVKLCQVYHPADYTSYSPGERIIPVSGNSLSNRYRNFIDIFSASNYESDLKMVGYIEKLKLRTHVKSFLCDSNLSKQHVSIITKTLLKDEKKHYEFGDFSLFFVTRVMEVIAFLDNVEQDCFDKITFQLTELLKKMTFNFMYKMGVDIVKDHLSNMDFILRTNTIKWINKDLPNIILKMRIWVSNFMCKCQGELNMIVESSQNNYIFKVMDAVDGIEGVDPVWRRRFERCPTVAEALKIYEDHESCHVCREKMTEVEEVALLDCCDHLLCLSCAETWCLTKGKERR